MMSACMNTLESTIIRLSESARETDKFSIKVGLTRCKTHYQQHKREEANFELG